MTNKEAIEMFKAIMMAEIDRLPYHYDAEIDEDVYDDISRVDEILQLNKIVSKALKKADKYRWHDLRKNPDDLPVKAEYVEVITDEHDDIPLSIQYDDAIMQFGERRILLGYVDSVFIEWEAERRGKIIAWRYIEPFEEEE